MIVPLATAYRGVPDLAMMSTPSWRRPPERGACQVSANQHGPSTGNTVGSVAVALGVVVDVVGIVVVVVVVDGFVFGVENPATKPT